MKDILLSVEPTTLLWNPSFMCKQKYIVEKFSCTYLFKKLSWLGEKNLLFYILLLPFFQGSARFKWKTEAGGNGVKGHGQAWQGMSSWDVLGFLGCSWVSDFCVDSYWMSQLSSWFVLVRVREGRWGEVMDFSNRGFCLFLWRHLSLLHSRALMELRLFFPLGQQGVFLWSYH